MVVCVCVDQDIAFRYNEHCRRLFLVTSWVTTPRHGMLLPERTSELISVIEIRGACPPGLEKRAQTCWLEPHESYARLARTEIQARLVRSCICVTILQINNFRAKAASAKPLESYWPGNHRRQSLGCSVPRYAQLER